MAQAAHFPAAEVIAKQTQRGFQKLRLASAADDDHKNIFALKFFAMQRPCAPLTVSCDRSGSRSIRIQAAIALALSGLGGPRSAGARPRQSLCSCEGPPICSKFYESFIPAPS